MNAISNRVMLILFSAVPHIEASSCKNAGWDLEG